MAKYHELMEHIEVPGEMRERVLKNIDRHFSRKAGRKKRAMISLFGPLAVAAAFGIVIWNPLVRFGDTETPGIEQGIYWEEEYPSAKALSEAAGFSVAEVENIPFEVEKAEYRLITGDLAEIAYSGEGDTLTFRVSAGEEDNSGNYTVYEEEKEVRVQGKTVALRGEKGKYYLAVWKEAGYSYSLWDVRGLDEELFLKMIS